jgi:hypothetical protein
MVIGNRNCVDAFHSAGAHKSIREYVALIVANRPLALPVKIAGGMDLKIAIMKVRASIHIEICLD